MNRTRNILLAAGVAALLGPAAASAQNWGGRQDQGSQYQQRDQRGGDYRNGDQRSGDYRNGDQRGGDYRGGDRRDGGRFDQRSFGGYPEFANLEIRLQQKIQEGRREGWLSQDRAQRFVDRYKEIRNDEGRVFRQYGWNLPEREREGFRQRIRELEQRLDESRGERRRY